MIVSGCTSSSVVVGPTHPAISPDQVKVYASPPPNYQEVAILDATSEFSLAITGQGQTDVAIDRMKSEAAKLGANGILIRAINTSYVNSGGVGSVNASGGDYVYWGGGDWGDSVKDAQGIAIYVPPAQ